MAKRESRPRRVTRDKAPPASVETEARFPIVGIGASAGGLEAFTQLLAHLPADCGMAFVLIQHLDPTKRSLLSEALRRATEMPVSQAEDDTRVEANHVYVIPENADISLRHGRLALVPRDDDSRKLHLPIDAFLRALAGELGSRAIGVVLSGTATDGTEGLRAIKAEGGITFAQAPGTAKFEGMPRSAIEAGVVDYHLPIPELAQGLLRLSRHPYVVARAESAEVPTDQTAMAGIVGIVKTVVGVDFSEYKAPTFGRRLARRMALRGVDDQSQYLNLLQGDLDEVRALCEEALIHVTGFFRDPKAFAALKASVFPEILKHKPEGAPIRVWSAGCSSGEEAYSLAISLLEFLGDHPHRSPHPVQIFASDASELAIEKARAGSYSDGAMLGISDERRRRFFTKVDGGYRINKSVRALCVFVRHDLARDPPFSKLDLVSCRNVLIYFEQPLQKRVLPTLHYGLNQPGFLLLGRTEHVSGFGQLFSPVDRAHKIFARSARPSMLRFAPRSEVHPPAGAPILRARPDQRRSVDTGKHLDRLLLARYAPAGVLINERMEILQFRGETGAYLQPAPGEPQTNLIKMARSGLLSKLRATLARADGKRAPARTAGVEIDQDGFTRTCDLVVVPFAGLPDVKEKLFVVLFEEPQRPRAKAPPARASKLKKTRHRPAARRFEHELAATKEYLRSVIEEHGRTNDDLGSANEELVSGNEELQSLNEELETAKEELQSTNEELTTVNDELQSRNQEMSQVNSDLVNLLTTVDIPILILDADRRIRRFTPQARHILNVLSSDVGRLLDDIKLNIDVPDLDRRVAEVIETVVAQESEVEDRDGRWHKMHIRPYKTTDNKIDGAIVSLFDINALKHHADEAQRAKEEAERADRAKDQFLATLSHELRAPLAATLMHAQMLRRGGLNSVKVERACEAIERLTKTQVQLIDDLLDVSRIVTGKLKVELGPVGLGAVVESAVEGVTASAQKKSIEIKVYADDSVGPVSGDRTRLEQVVSNLLTNAIKFTPAEGQVTVVLETVDGKACLRVKDTGVGIEPGFLPRIFDRFTQEDSSRTRAHGGLGLGLAIVEHLVKAHGGTVRAESPGTGKGATFHVTLPLIVPTGSASAQPQPAPPRSASGGDVPTGEDHLRDLRVLIVDDDASTCDALAEMLSQTGATVRTAGSATAGMTAFEEFHPDVLLCDIAMPFEDGYSLIRRIRTLGGANGGRTPALALTALAGPEDRRRALDAGFQLHLAKPVDVDRLTVALRDLTSAERAAAT